MASTISSPAPAISTTAASVVGIYHALPHRRCTRLVEILEPFSKGERLSLRFSIMDLGEVASAGNDGVRPVAFAALSYTWGAPLHTAESKEKYGPEHDVPVDIVMEDSQRSFEVWIGRNLYEALVHIYESGERLPLWVDALCINQSDSKEKIEQVLMMSDIYSKAMHVIVWFGIDDPDQPTFDDIFYLHTTLLDQVDEYVKANGRFQPASFSISTERTIRIVEMGLSLPVTRMKSLFRFYAERRYLSRAWVVQEIALARKCIVLLGHHYIPYERLSLLIDRLSIGYIANLGGFFTYDDDPGINNGAGVELFDIACTAEVVRDWTSSTMVTDLATVYGSCDDSTTYLALLEFNLSGKGGQRSASDPRDIIYSMLGIANFVLKAQDPPIRPDYFAPIEHVYTSITTQLLLNLPYRTVLSLIGRRQISREAEFVDHLPSWVPDFTCIKPFLMYQCIVAVRTGAEQFAAFKAGLDHPQYSTLDVHDQQLTLYGRRCGSIDLSFTYTKELRPYGSIIERMRTDLSLNIPPLEFCVRLGQQYPTGDSTIEAIFRVLCLSTFETQGKQDFCDCLHNTLCCMIAEARLVCKDQTVLALADHMAGLLGQWDDSRAMPWQDEFERYETTFRFLLGSMPREEALVKVQALWPELEISRDGQAGPGVHYFNSMRMTKTISIGDTLFSTNKKYVGRVANTVQRGDELWLICQAKVPFVLRPTTEGKYILLGEAFVHGAMYGELIENGIAEEPREITII